MRKRTWPDFKSCDSTTNERTVNSSPVSVLNDDESQVARSSAKTFTNSETTTARRRDSSGSCPAWSISSLLAVLPDSPPPICSSNSSSLSPSSFTSPCSEIFCSQASTPINQNSCILQMLSPSSVDINEWIEDANDNCSSYKSDFQSKEDECTKCISVSTGFESAITEIHSMKLHSIDEEECTIESRRSKYVASDSQSPIDGHHKLMSRPKPYQEFLEEIKRQEHDAQLNAWKNAKHMEYMDRLKRKEAAISNWEFKQIGKVMKGMKKIERKLEKKQAKANAETQMKISKIQKEADEMKANERNSVASKISIIAKTSNKNRATKNSLLLKLTRSICC